MTEPTDGAEGPEGWTEGETEDLNHRIELLTHRAGVADVVRWIDPEHEGPGRPAGLEKCEPVALLDLGGHLHPPMEVVEAGLAPQCVPAFVPFQFDLELLDDLIADLQTARVELARRIDAMGQDR